MAGANKMAESSDSEYEPDSAGSEVQVNVPACRSQRPSRNVKEVDYTKEGCDQFFTGVSGYTNFNRTRKGGDVRPNSKVCYILYIVHT